MKPTEAFHSIVGTDGQVHCGITTRDYIAIEVMKAMISSGHDHHDGLGDEERFSKMAYKYADALIKQSNEKHL